MCARNVKDTAHVSSFPFRQIFFPLRCCGRLGFDEFDSLGVTGNTANNKFIIGNTTNNKLIGCRNGTVSCTQYLIPSSKMNSTSGRTSVGKRVKQFTQCKQCSFTLLRQFFPLIRFLVFISLFIHISGFHFFPFQFSGYFTQPFVPVIHPSDHAAIYSIHFFMPMIHPSIHSIRFIRSFTSLSLNTKGVSYRMMRMNTRTVACS